MAVLRSVAKTDTFETQRQKINQIAQDVFSIGSGGSDLSTGNLKLGDGTREAPSLSFVSDSTLGIYKPNQKTFGIVSESKKVVDFSNLGTYSFKDMVVQRRELDNLESSFTTLNSGSNYDAGTYSDVRLIGGTGDNAEALIVVTEYAGSITNDGAGYREGQFSTISLNGGDGVGATASFIVRGIVGSIIQEGSNYVPGTYEDAALTGGFGSGATANIFVASPGAGTLGGNITSVTITSNGNNNYRTGDILSVSDLGGSGSGFQFEITSENPGQIDQFTFTDKGTGYQPTNIFTLPGAKTGISTDLKGEVTGLTTTLSSSSPTFSVSSTVGIVSGMSAVSNQGDPGQINFGTTVLSVDSINNTVTLSANPSSSGSTTVSFRSQGTLTEIVVPSLDGIFSGSIVTKTSGAGQLDVNTTVLGVNTSTNTVILSSEPILAGPVVLSFAPPYGIPVTNFSYTVGTLGAVESFSLSSAGNGYSISDTLTVNASDLSAPITYYVKNIVAQKLYFNSITGSSFSIGDTIRKIDGAVVVTQLVSSTDIAGQADQSYIGVTTTSNGTGQGAIFNVFRGLNGVVSSVIATNTGLKYNTGDFITITGNQIGGSTPADNITLQVNSASLNTEYQVYGKVLDGSNIDYILTESTQIDLFEDGDIIVKNNNYNSTYTIDTASPWTFRYLIDLDEGNGFELTPSWEVYAGDTYLFDLSDSSNTSHVFALSEYRDGIWGPSYIQNISTTLSISTDVITVSDTSNILAGMNVTLVSGDGALASNTKVLSVEDETTIILDTVPIQDGNVVLNFRGYAYPDGVSSSDSGLLLKVTENTPSLYYFCNFDNIAHVDEGGEDFEEGIITVNPVNPRVFGSGFNVLVNNINTDNVITLGIEDGTVTALEFIGDDALLQDATVTGTLTAPIISGNSITASTITSPSNLVLNGGAINVNGNFNVGTNIQTVASSGNITTSGVLRTNSSLNINNILTIENNNISTSAGNNILLTPPIGQVAKVSSSTALIIPVGSSAQRPTSEIVDDGAIRFNTDTNQYEGYSATTTSWSSLGGVRDLDGNTYIAAEAFTGANDNILYFFNDNNNTLKLSTSYLDFNTVKKLRSLNTSLPLFTTWASNTPVSLGSYVKYRNNLYEVTLGGVTGTSGSEPTHTSGTLINGTAELTWYISAVAPLAFEEISELQVGPLGNLPLVVNSDLRLATNVISTDVSDLVIRPNAGKRVTIDAATSLVIPAGDSNSRGVSAQGSIRYNTTITQYEGYNGTNWTSLGGVKDVDGNTYIIPETAPGENENILYFYNDGENTLQLSKTALNFQTISTISSTSNSLAINANLVSFDNLAASIDNSGTSTFISSTQENLDLGLSVGLNNDHLLRMNTFGDIIINRGFGTGIDNNLTVLTNELTDFELEDTKLSSSDVNLIKGTTNTGSSVVYSPTLASGSKIVVSAYNNTTNDVEMVEFNVTDKGTDIYHTEYGNLVTGGNLIDVTFDFDASNDVRINFALNSSVQEDDEVNITVVKTIIKK